MQLELRASWGASILLVVVALMLLGLRVAFAPLAWKVIGIVVVAALLALAIAFARRRLVMDERGVTARGVLGVKHLDWNEVDHYTFYALDQSMAYGAAGAQGGAIGVIVAMAIVAAVRAARRNKSGARRFVQGQLALVGKSGTRLPIDGRYRNVADALDRAFAELHPRLRAATPDFAPFALGDSELRHAKKGAIGLAEIQHVGAGGACVFIKKHGKRLAWVRVPMKRVKNVLLFIELLAERGVVTKTDVFVPPSVLDKLRAAASRQDALPHARVVSRGS